MHPVPAVRACDQAGRPASRLRPGGQAASGLTNLPPGPGWGAFSYRCAGGGFGAEPPIGVSQGNQDGLFFFIAPLLAGRSRSSSA
jgi:hypothetical protein